MPVVCSIHLILNNVLVVCIILLILLSNCNSLCHYLQNHWKLDDSRKKIVLEKAAKLWRDFKGKLTKNFLRAGKDPSEVYHFISQEQWEIFRKKRESEEFKVKKGIKFLYCMTHSSYQTNSNICSNNSCLIKW